MSDFFRQMVKDIGMQMIVRAHQITVAVKDLTEKLVLLEVVVHGV